MPRLLSHPLFWIGVAVRITMLALLNPSLASEFFVPFVTNSLADFTLDPWRSWQASSGDTRAFPYGYVMWVGLVPGIALTDVLGVSTVLGYQLTLFAFDFLLLTVVSLLAPNRLKLVLATYWLSPIVLFSIYGLGLNDVVPALLLTISYMGLRQSRFALSGCFLALAISAKISMVAALPFLLVFFIKSRAGKPLKKFGLTLAVTSALVWTPFVMSPNAMRMLVGNPDIRAVSGLSVALSDGGAIYALPLLYGLLVYFFWRVRRTNLALLQSIIGSAFLVLVLLAPLSLGWLIWALPFLVLYQASSGRTAIWLVASFSTIYVANYAVNAFVQDPEGVIAQFVSIFGISASIAGLAAGWISTTTLLIGSVLAVRMWRESISRNELVRATRKPFAIGIAGDSGAGKDTYADALASTFGPNFSKRISGDDYHLWDRQEPMWKVMTHLNPSANHLDEFAEDVLELVDGKTVVRRQYDHRTGTKTHLRKLRSRDFIIVSGLHALHLPHVRAVLDLKVFLDIDESLRRYFKLRRDVYERGHRPSDVLDALNRRKMDSETFVLPQKGFADLVFSVCPTKPLAEDAFSIDSVPELKLLVFSREGFPGQKLARVLIGLCGLRVDEIPRSDSEFFGLSIEGTVSGRDIDSAVAVLVPGMRDLLDPNPEWERNTLGLMQLITLYEMSRVFSRRLIQ